MTNTTKQNIVIVGGGNMGTAIAVGLLNQGYTRDQIEIVEPAEEQRTTLRQTHDFTCHADVNALTFEPAVVVLAVKPQIMREVLRQLKPVLAPLQQSSLLISIAAGITTSQIANCLAGNYRIIRVMPNTPAMIGLGASASYCNEIASATDKATANDILSAIGINVWVAQESDIDAVTALSGSGPAYFFLVFEALEAAAVKLGLTIETARLLSLQTALGAASLAQQSGLDPAKLREQVTSPGGTTERALEVLAANDLTNIFADALNAAHQRAQELAKLSD